MPTIELPAEVEEILDAFEPGGAANLSEEILEHLRDVKALPLWPRLDELAKMNSLAMIHHGHPPSAHAVMSTVMAVCGRIGCVYGELQEAAKDRNPAR